MWFYRVVILSIIFLFKSVNAQEVSLFDEAGKATAYITVDDEMIVYLWDGKPVAYLEEYRQGGYQIYGFNGKHLGWFEKGIAWDHRGKVSCSIKQVLQFTEFEPFKGLKKLKPLKSLKQLSPLRPIFSMSFSDKPCRFFLSEGA